MTPCLNTSNLQSLLKAIREISVIRGPIELFRLRPADLRAVRPMPSVPDGRDTRALSEEKLFALRVAGLLGSG